MTRMTDVVLPTASFTPGPWHVEEGTTVIWSLNAYDPGTNCVGCVVARAAQPSSWKGCRPTADEQDANARLIAAAPTMLEALENAGVFFEGSENDGCVVHRMIIEALAKAKAGAL